MKKKISPMFKMVHVFRLLLVCLLTTLFTALVVDFRVVIDFFDKVIKGIGWILQPFGAIF